MGICESIAEDVFEVGEDGQSHVLIETYQRSGELR